MWDYKVKCIKGCVNLVGGYKMEMAKHSWREAFGSVASQVGLWVEGKYTRVFFLPSGPVVKQNTTGTNSKKLTGKIAKLIISFVEANLEQAK